MSDGVREWRGEGYGAAVAIEEARNENCQQAYSIHPRTIPHIIPVITGLRTILSAIITFVTLRTYDPQTNALDPSLKFTALYPPVSLSYDKWRLVSSSKPGLFEISSFPRQRTFPSGQISFPKTLQALVSIPLTKPKYNQHF